MNQENPEVKSQASSAQQFKEFREKRLQPHTLTLPSGLVVSLKRPSIKILISSGVIPDAIAGKIMNMDKDTSGKTVIRPQQMHDIVEFQKIVATHALVSPKVVDQPDYDNNEISIDDIDADDQDAIMSFVVEGVEADKTAASFRDKQ
jgi:hypothetical protein